MCDYYKCQFQVLGKELEKHELFSIYLPGGITRPNDFKEQDLLTKKEYASLSKEKKKKFIKRNFCFLHAPEKAISNESGKYKYDLACDNDIENNLIILFCKYLKDTNQKSIDLSGSSFVRKVQLDYEFAKNNKLDQVQCNNNIVISNHLNFNSCIFHEGITIENINARIISFSSTVSYKNIEIRSVNTEEQLLFVSSEILGLTISNYNQNKWNNHVHINNCKIDNLSVIGNNFYYFHILVSNIGPSTINENLFSNKMEIRNSHFNRGLSMHDNVFDHDLLIQTEGRNLMVHDHHKSLPKKEDFVKNEVIFIKSKKNIYYLESEGCIKKLDIKSISNTEHKYKAELIEKSFENQQPGIYSSGSSDIKALERFASYLDCYIPSQISKIEGDLSFRRNVVRRNAYIHNISFLGDVFFDDSKFEFLSIRKSIFRYVPRLYGTIIKEHIMEINIDQIDDTNISHAQYSYRKLKRMAGDERNKEEESKFYRLEMESALNSIKTWNSQRLLLSLYKNISDYGNSVVQPIKALIFIMLMFLDLYIITGSNGPNILQIILNTFKPFSITAADSVNILSKYISIFHSLFSVGIITLFIFAIRRKLTIR